MFSTYFSQAPDTLTIWAPQSCTMSSLTAYIWRQLGVFHLHLLMKSIFEHQGMCDGDPVRLHRMLLPIVEVAHLQEVKHNYLPGVFCFRIAHIWVEEVGHPWPIMAGCHLWALKRKLEEPGRLSHNSRPLMHILSVKGDLYFAYMMFFVLPIKKFDFSSSDTRCRLSRQLTTQAELAASACSFIRGCSVSLQPLFSPSPKLYSHILVRTSNLGVLANIWQYGKLTEQEKYCYSFLYVQSIFFCIRVS